MTNTENKSYCVFSISKEEILKIAKMNELNINNIDFDNILHYITQGIDASIDDVRMLIIKNAIKLAIKKL